MATRMSTAPDMSPRLLRGCQRLSTSCGFLISTRTGEDGWLALLDHEPSVASEAMTFEPVAFDHPLYVLFSSGTTGLPKPIVHCHGGITVEHVKALALHYDLGPGDRFCWFTTTGWMMWNFLTSAALVGATAVLFDGDPGSPDLSTLWSLAAREHVDVLGVSAPFVMACRKAGLRPVDDHDLAGLRHLGSTGAPLPPEGFRWIVDAVGERVQIGSLSGGHRRVHWLRRTSANAPRSNRRDLDADARV